jgi:hypothetical protein
LSFGRPSQEGGGGQFFVPFVCANAESHGGEASLALPPGTEPWRLSFLF